MDWKEEFLAILSVTSPTTADIDRGMAIKAKHLPPFLHKYQRFNTNSINNLEADQVWICSADQFNDLYECSLSSDFEAELRAVSAKHLDHLVPIVSQFLSEIELAEAKISSNPFDYIFNALKNRLPMDQQPIAVALRDVMNDLGGQHITKVNEFMQHGMKVSCFCEAKDSPTMWGRYADSNKGFCVEYKVADWPEKEKRWLYPVMYTKERFDATPYLVRFISDGVCNPLLGVLAAIHKELSWSDEKEWRIVLPTGADTSGVGHKMPCPSGLYLGARISATDERTIRQVAISKQVPVYKGSASPGSFGLSWTPL